MTHKFNESEINIGNLTVVTNSSFIEMNEISRACFDLLVNRKDNMSVISRKIDRNIAAYAYNILQEDSDVKNIPSVYRLSKIDYEKKILPINIHIKENFGNMLRTLIYWCEHFAKNGSFLFVDYPENMLHPTSEIKLARLFVRLVNVGVKVFIITNSDFIIKEFNNCIMLGQVADSKFIIDKINAEIKGENLGMADILKISDIQAHICKIEDGKNIVKNIDIDKYGMLESVFDDTIDKQNYNSRTLAAHVVD